MSSAPHPAPAPSSGWTNWIRFAGVILLVNGIFSVVLALAALVGPNTYYAVTEGDVFLFDAAGWGWWNLIIGAFLILTAFGLFASATWARIVGVVLAVISAVVQLLLVPLQPWWSLIVIAVDVLIIYALIARGDEHRIETLR